MSESTPYLGQKVVLNTLLCEGDFLGEIVEVRPELLPYPRMCVVRLECQEAPVSGVLYYAERPEEVLNVLWQVCWPRSEKGE